jgi:hypothetical protein
MTADRRVALTLIALVACLAAAGAGAATRGAPAPAAPVTPQATRGAPAPAQPVTPQTTRGAPAPAQPVTPQTTVRWFLDAAFVRRDAEGACAFLTPVQRTRVGGSRGCPAALRGLPRVRGDRLGVTAHGPLVTVTGLAAPLALRLAPLTAGPRPEAVAPATGWRIAAGAEALVPPRRAG